MRNNRVVCVALVVLSALFGAACGGSDSSPSSPTVGASPHRGGTLTWLAGADLNAGFFPDAAQAGGGPQVGSGTIERFAIYDALAVLGTDGTVRYRLASSMTTDDGGTTWRLRLRPSVVFSDGTPLDAAAVAYNWTRAADPATKSPLAPLAARISGTEVVDQATLKVTLKVPNAQFPRSVAQSGLAFIGSPTAMQTMGAAFGKAPVGAGPFVVKRWQQRDRLVLDRNERYHGPAAYADELVIRYVPDDAQRYTTLKTGGGDVAMSSDWTTYGTARDDGLDVGLSVQSGGMNIQFNTKTAPFDQVDARRALAYALDLDGMDQDLFQGGAELAATLFRKGSPFYVDVRQPGSDDAKAQGLFDELAGSGHPVEFTLTNVFPGMSADIAQWMQARLTGFKHVTMRVEAVTSLAPIVAGSFQATILPSPRFVDPYPQLTNWLGTGSPSNFGKFSDPALDAALSEGQRATTVEARRAAYRDVAGIIRSDVPVLFLVRVPNQRISRHQRIGDLPVVNDGLPDWGRIWKR